MDFILSLECDRFVHLFSRQEGASMHCQIGGTTNARAIIFGWLDHVLCGKPLVSESDASAADRFEEAFARYGGPAAVRRAQEALAVAHLV
jgi:hypothetical protein